MRILSHSRPENGRDACGARWLRKEFSEVNSQLVDSLRVEQLIEANQQWVLAILSAQSDIEKSVDGLSKSYFLG